MSREGLEYLSRQDRGETIKPAQCRSQTCHRSPWPPDEVLKSALRLWESELTAIQALTSWRYKLDAKATADQAETVEGDASLFPELVGYLDKEVKGFSMHQR